jgi:ribonuclease HI
VSVARSTTGDRTETRETMGRVDGDRNGRSAPLRAIVDAFSPFEGLSCRVSVDTSSMIVFDGMTDKGKRTRSTVGDVTWIDVDRIVAGHEIVWHMTPRRVDSDLCERTDRTLRMARGAATVF